MATLVCSTGHCLALSDGVEQKHLAAQMAAGRFAVFGRMKGRSRVKRLKRV